MNESELKCTNYAVYDGDDTNVVPAHCPVCGGFLKWIVKEREWIPICSKCKSDLIAIPAVDEETKEELDYGKICPIGERKRGNKNES